MEFNDHRWKAVAVLSAVLVMGSLGNGVAQEAGSPDPKALLEKLTDFYRSMKAVSVRSEIVVSINGEVGQVMKQTLKLRRPNQMSLVTTGAGQFFSTPSAYLDQNVGSLVVDEKRVIRAEGIDSVEAFFRSPALGYNPEAAGNMILDQNLALVFLNKLLFAELGKGWQEDLAGVRFVGEEEVGGLNVYQLVLSTETRQFGEVSRMDLKIAIQKGDEPFLLRLEPDMSQLFPQEEGQEKTDLKMVSTWSGWNTNPSMDGNAFQAPAFEEGVQIYPSAEAMVQAQTAEENPALTLTGLPAPEIDLPLLTEGRFKLSDEKGKSVVVIGFWASILGDESDYLKVLQAVGDQLRGRGVRVVAVNVGDTPENAKAYMERAKATVTVPMDREQTFLEDYKVRTIPQTIVVDRDGEVIQVHVGTDAVFEEELLAELKRIVTTKETVPAAP